MDETQRMSGSSQTRGARRRYRASRARIGILGAISRSRGGLLGSTALQAAVLTLIGTPGNAQSVAPGTLPQGGQVIAGAARIATAGTAMQVTQTSNNATVNWNSFSIGGNASVTFAQPSTQAVVINRVIGPDPSVIAGRLSANGQVVLTNQSGVTFTDSALVNVQTLVVSAPGISEANAKAGNLVFDQAARPGAKVVNQGSITVGQTGLAALVAPQVANSGVITAKMGHVVLAGAEAHTVDLYGDGMLSVDVTKQVTTAPIGADGKPVLSLVTNTGLIQADGGTVVLTAGAVDGIVQNLVTAGGTVSAATLGSNIGQVSIGGTGGSVIIQGTIAARGDAAGTMGGQVAVNAPGHNVTLAAGSKIDVSGRAGGGTVAVGTTIARAQNRKAAGTPTARNVKMDRDAFIVADAIDSGKGGNVVLLSKGGSTDFAGSISARGGVAGGEGGLVEISGDALTFVGKANVGAVSGRDGTVLIDPDSVEIATGGAATLATSATDGTTGTVTLDPATITGAKVVGNLEIDASKDITVTNALDFTGGGVTVTGFTLRAGNNITVNADITSHNSISLIAGDSGVTQCGDHNGCSDDQCHCVHRF